MNCWRQINLADKPSSWSSSFLPQHFEFLRPLKNWIIIRIRRLFSESQEFSLFCVLCWYLKRSPVKHIFNTFLKIILFKQTADNFESKICLAVLVSACWYVCYRSSLLHSRCLFVNSLFGRTSIVLCIFPNFQDRS